MSSLIHVDWGVCTHTLSRLSLPLLDLPIRFTIKTQRDRTACPFRSCYEFIAISYPKRLVWRYPAFRYLATPKKSPAALPFGLRRAI